MNVQSAIEHERWTKIAESIKKLCLKAAHLINYNVSKKNKGNTHLTIFLIGEEKLRAVMEETVLPLFLQEGMLLIFIDLYDVLNVRFVKKRY